MIKNHLTRRPSKVMYDRFRHVPQGGDIHSIPKRYLPRRFQDPEYFKFYDGNGCYRRLCWDFISPTVLASSGDNSMLIHPEHNRLLSIRELARMQTFPDRYEFTGGHGSMQRQVGNAVPCRMARQLAKALSGW